jgi:hypothetical protein
MGQSAARLGTGPARVSTRQRGRRTRQKEGNSYGNPLELLWNSYGIPMDHHHGTAVAPRWHYAPGKLTASERTDVEALVGRWF